MPCFLWALFHLVAHDLEQKLLFVLAILAFCFVKDVLHCLQLTVWVLEDVDDWPLHFCEQKL